MGLLDFLGGSKPKIPKPTDIWAMDKSGLTAPAKQAQGLLGYYGEYVPQFLELNKQFAPQILGQNVRSMGQLSAGLGGILQGTTASAQRALESARSSDIASMGANVGAVRSMLQNLSPEQVAELERQQRLAAAGEEAIGAYGEQAPGLLSKYGAGRSSTMARRMAAEAFARRGQLSPEEQRAAQQQAREAAAASGRLGGTSSIAAEILNREQAMAARRAEATGLLGLSSQLGSMAFGQAQDVERTKMGLRELAGLESQRAYSSAGNLYSPGLGILSSTPASLGVGASMAAQSMAAPSMSGSFDYNQPIGMALGYAGAMDQRNLAKYQADMQARQSGFGALGSLVSLAAIPFTGGLSAGLGLTGLAGGAAGATGMSGLGLSAGMGLSNLFGGIRRATPVAG